MAEWTILSRYATLKKIEVEGIGEVWKCRDSQTQKDVTVRCYPDGDSLPHEIAREVLVLQDLDHNNVARLFEATRTPNDHWYVVCDYLDYDIDSLIKADDSPIDPQVMKNLLFQMFRGLNYCHSQKIVHRNLNPHTVLYDRDTSTVKLADFSYAIKADGPLVEFPAEVTSPKYKAPEILLGKTYTSAVDVWSVGCIFAEIVARVPFFTGDSDDLVLDEIRSKIDVNTSAPNMISACLSVCGREKLPPKSISDLAEVAPQLESEAIDLLSKMLRRKPSERITAKAALEHPYFKNVHRFIFSV